MPITIFLSPRVNIQIFLSVWKTKKKQQIITFKMLEWGSLWHCCKWLKWLTDFHNSWLIFCQLTAHFSSIIMFTYERQCPGYSGSCPDPRVSKSRFYWSNHLNSLTGIHISCSCSNYSHIYYWFCLQFPQCIMCRVAASCHFHYWLIYL